MSSSSFLAVSNPRVQEATIRFPVRSCPRCCESFRGDFLPSSALQLSVHSSISRLFMRVGVIRCTYVPPASVLSQTYLIFEITARACSIQSARLARDALWTRKPYAGCVLLTINTNSLAYISANDAASSTLHLPIQDAYTSTRHRGCSDHINERLCLGWRVFDEE